MTQVYQWSLDPFQEYPASYFSGPLGSANVVPADSAGKLLGIWYGNDATAAQTRTQLQQRITDIGRTPDLIGCQLDQLTDAGVNSEDWIHGTLNSIPVITWHPNGSASIEEINAGTHDTEIDNLANRLKDAAGRVIVSPFREFDSSWLNYTSHEKTVLNWTNAWKRIVDRFQSAGADNVGFFWTPAEVAGTSDRAWVDDYYPGDDYVDWVGSTQYNRFRDDIWNTPLHSGWADYRELVDYTDMGWGEAQPLASVFGNTKPFITAETGSKYDAATPTRKGEWFRRIDEVAIPNQPLIRGIIFFDQFVPGEGNIDWRVDRDQGPVDGTAGNVDAVTYQGFKDLVQIARWRVGVRGGPT